MKIACQLAATVPTLPGVSEGTHCVCVQSGLQATVSPEHSEISQDSWIVNLQDCTCSCLYPQVAGMPCSHVVAVMRTPNSIVSGNNMARSYSINLHSPSFLRWMHQSWLMINYKYSVEHMNVVMISIPDLLLDEVTLPNKRKAGPATKGPQRHKRFQSFGERSGGGGGAFARDRTHSTHTVSESAPTVTPRACSQCGSYTHTCLNHHRISLHANRVASETETIIDEVLNFPTLGILRDE